MKFAERFVDVFIGRLRILFSIEMALSILIFFLLYQIPAVADWYSPKSSYESLSAQELIRQVSYNQNLGRIRFLGVFLLVTVVVFGVGEIVRRKFKRKSLIFGNKGKGEK